MTRTVDDDEPHVVKDGRCSCGEIVCDDCGEPAHSLNDDNLCSHCAKPVKKMSLSLSLRDTDPDDIADLLEQIGGMIREGYTSGFPPNGTWSLSDPE